MQKNYFVFPASFSYPILFKLKNYYLIAIAILLAPSICAAEEINKKSLPKLSASGFVNFSAAIRNQNQSFEHRLLPDNFSKNYLNQKNSIGNDSQIFLKGSVTDEGKKKYGAVAKFEFNINSDSRNELPNLDQINLFAENDFGKFEFGNIQPVNQKMKSGPARFVRGSGGINGKYLEHVNLPMFANSMPSQSCNNEASGSCSNLKLPHFILLAQSPIGHGGYARSSYLRNSNGTYSTKQGNNFNFMQANFRTLKDDSFEGPEDATKISYYSPRIEGLQVGVSYAPSSVNIGFTANTSLATKQAKINNIFSFAANYLQDFDNFELSFSATAEKGLVKNFQPFTSASSSNSSFLEHKNNLFAYDFASTISYFGFSLGASFGSWGSSLQAQNGTYSCDYNQSQNLADQNCSSATKKFSNPYYYTAGLAYQFGPIGTSVTAIKSIFQQNKYQAISLGFDYKLNKNIMSYLEFTKFSFAVNHPKALDLLSAQGSLSNIYNNSGDVFLTGILYSF